MIGALPALSRAEVQLGRNLPRRRMLPPVLGRDLEVGPVPATVPDATILGVSFHTGPARLSVPAPVLREILGELDPAATEAPADWRALLLEQALSPALDALQMAAPLLALTISLEVPPPGVCPYYVGLTLGGQAMRLELSEPAATALAAALADVPTNRTAMPYLPVRLAARLAWCTLSLDALRKTVPGDVILPDSPGHGRLFLTAGETIRWPARHEPGRLTVDGARAVLRPEGDFWMQDAALPGAETDSLDDLPIRLSFEIAQIDLTLAELESLGPGHVFELNRPEADGVDIIANGRRIGAGRAITINGTLGVQIVRLRGR